jgi:predicted transcriptional regulator
MKKRQKKGITIKIPKKKLQAGDTYERVKNHLQNNSEYAYTRAGLIVELYEYTKDELDAPFKDWPKGAPNQYTRIKRVLAKLEEEGLIESKKEGKRFLYWWKD